MPEDLTLGDVVRQLALLMEEKGVVLVFKNEEPWHLLFFRMKGELKDGPAFLNRLRFDADNRYPRCRELSEFLHALHTTCTAGVENPSYDELELDSKVTELWKKEQSCLGPETKAFLSRSLEIAREEFPLRTHA